MKTKPPLTALERAKHVADQWAALEREADQLCDRLAEENRPPHYAGVCLRADWGSNKVPAGELLKRAILWVEQHQRAHYPELVDDGTSL